MYNEEIHNLEIAINGIEEVKDILSSHKFLGGLRTVSSAISSFLVCLSNANSEITDIMHNIACGNENESGVKRKINKALQQVVKESDWLLPIIQSEVKK